MKPLVFHLFGQDSLANKITQLLDYEKGKLEFREFPDKESYLRFQTDVKDREVIIIDSLDYPNIKTLSLLFAAKAAKDLGASKVGLVTPYLAYMRQDKRFHPGEAVTSTYFAKLLSESFDWLITVDPHLHRIHHLDEIYSIPSIVINSARKVANWINQQVEQPLLVGPDAESEQWVAKVAEMANAPHIVLQKIRHGDKKVEVSVPEVEQYKEYTPVLFDDIISTARTMIETVKHLQKAKMKPAICIGVHAVFAEDAYDRLLNAHVSQIVTCNTISHLSNQIDLSTEIAEAVKQFS